MGSALEIFTYDEARTACDRHKARDCELYYCIGRAPSNIDFALPMDRLGKDSKGAKGRQ